MPMAVTVELALAYAQAMRALVRSDPADIDVKVLAAESLMALTSLDMWHGNQPNTSNGFSILRACVAPTV